MCPTLARPQHPSNHGAAYDRQTFSYPLHCPPPSSAVLRPMKCTQPACDSQRSSGRSILVSTPVMARSLPRAGLAQPRGGVSTKSLLPTWFCQPRTGSTYAVGVWLGRGCARGIGFPGLHVLYLYRYPVRATRELMLSTPLWETETHPMPFYLVLHAPHSSAASPRLVMEPGS